jgi:translation initiation factor RLI1
VPKRMVVVDYRKCQPDKCDGSICLAVLACPQRVLQQEVPYEVPNPNPAMCVGYGLCAQACPAKAIQMI